MGDSERKRHRETERERENPTRQLEEMCISVASSSKKIGVRAGKRKAAGYDPWRSRNPSGLSLESRP